MTQFVKATTVSEVAQNQSKICEINGKQIAIFNVAGRFCAIENVCPHRGGPVGEGDLEGTVVTCPWHGWQFDVTTGASPVNPAATIKKFNCKVEGSDILVEVD